MWSEQTTEIDTGDVTLSCHVAGEGKVVIALHGFPDHRGAFRPLLPALTGAGYKVIAPALRGYAPSGVAFSGRHDALAAGEDAVLLADHFSPHEPVRIVGHDWGAVAAFAAVAKAPRRFSHLVTMAVPHMAVAMRRLFRPAQLRRSWYVGLFQLPGIAEKRLVENDFAFIDRLWRDWSPGYSATREEIAAVKEGIVGRVGPVLAYYRALLSPSKMAESKPLFRKVQVPAIHLHGEEDGCFGIECAEGADPFYTAGYSMFRIAGAGHFLIQEKPDEVGRILLGFFGR